MQAGAIVADGAPDTVITGESLSSLYGVSVHVGRVDVPGRHAPRACVPMTRDGFA